MSFLSDKERATLTLLCDTLIPALEPEPGDDETLFQLKASDLDIPELVEQGLHRVTTREQQQQIRWVLRALETGLFNGLVAGQWCPFADMPLAAREKVLYRMATSRLKAARDAFQTFKRLTSFLFYAVMPEDEPNPVWPGLDYAIPGKTAVDAPRTIQPLQVNRAQTLETDVLVIGSGAGGGVVAGELAAAGYDVIVVEKGGYFSEGDFDGSELHGMETMYEKFGALVTADTSLAILAGSVLGGGTTINWAASLRVPDYVLDEWEREIGFEGASQLHAHYDAVAARINVNTDESIPNPNNQQLIKGCAALKYNVQTVPRNVKGCEVCSFCNYGCAFGAKQSTLRTYLQDVQDAGGRIIVRGHVDHIQHQGGRATGALVTVWGEDGRQHTVTIKAKVVVVSAGALHTPALLLRSGLINPNIGKHLHLHPTSVISGSFDDVIRPWEGAPISSSCFDFANLDGLGYGVWLENAPAHPGINGLAVSWINGRQHKRNIQNIPHMANIIILTRDRDGGQVTLDRAGQPVIHYTLSQYDSRHLMRGIKEAVKIYVAAGAKSVSTAQSIFPTFYPGKDGSLENFLQAIEKRGLRPNDFALFSAHQMGSARIGGDPARGAVDSTGRSYEVNNLYVADGAALPSAPGVNPMLTIMAVAHHTAQHIKARL